MGFWDFFGGGNAPAGNGVSVDYNKLYDQIQNTPERYTSMADVFNTGLLNGYNSFGGQMQNAMGAFGQVAALNSANNQALNRVNADYATGYQAPVDIARQQGQNALELERLRQQGQNSRLQALSPLLSGLMGTGNLGGVGASGSGSAPAGMTGFNAVGPDGKVYASASLGSGGGASGSQLGQAQPGNASNAQPTNVKQYTAPGKIPMNVPGNVPTDYYSHLTTGYGQAVAPEDAAAAYLRFKQTGHYSPTPYASQGAGISARVPAGY